VALVHNRTAYMIGYCYNIDSLVLYAVHPCILPKNRLRMIVFKSDVHARGIVRIVKN